MLRVRLLLLLLLLLVTSGVVARALLQGALRHEVGRARGRVALRRRSLRVHRDEARFLCLRR